MATASKTWVFLANAEGLADVGLDANLAFAWIAGDGNPAGSVEWLQTVGTAGDEKARKPTTDSWETLFGVPAGATVTDVQVTAWDSITWAVLNVAANGLRTRIRIVDSTGATVHSAGDLADVSEKPAIGGVVTGHGAGTSRAVDSAFQASTTGVRLEIQLTVTAAAGMNVDYEHDNVAITVTYTTGAPAVDAPADGVVTAAFEYRRKRLQGGQPLLVPAQGVLSRPPYASTVRRMMRRPVLSPLLVSTGPTTTTVGASISTPYAVNNAVGASRSQPYVVNAAVGASRTSPYVVNAAVGASRTAPYIVRTAVGASRTAPYEVIGVSISTLIDDFNDGSLAAKWLTSAVGGGTFAETGGQAQLTVPAYAGSFRSEHLSSTDLYSGLGGELSVDFGTIPANDAGRLIALTISGTQYGETFQFTYRNGTLSATDDVDGVNVQVTGLAALPRFLRMRHNSGTDVFSWEYSADAVTWTTVTTLPSVGTTPQRLRQWQADVSIVQDTGTPGTATLGVNAINLLPVGSSRSVPYLVSAPVGASRSTPYIVSAAVGASRTAPYVVRVAVGASRSSPYVVLNAVGASRSSPYVVSVAVGASRSSPYVVSTAVGASRTAPYVVRTAVGASRTAPYAVIAQVGASRSTPYVVSVAVGSSRTAPYVVSAQVGASRSTPFVVYTLAGASRSTPYVVLVAVGASRTAPYVVIAQVGASRSTPYLVSAAVGASRSAPYVVTTLASAGRSTPYVVANAVGSSRTAPYIVNVTAGASRSTPYVVAGPVGASRSTPYVVAVIVGASRSAPYVVATSVGASRTSPYVVRAAVGKSTTAPYVVIAQVGASRSVPYVVSTIVGSSRSTPFVVSVAFGKSTATPYVVAVSVGASRSVLYIVRAAVGSSRSAPYVVAQTAGASRSTPYVVTTAVGGSRSTPFVVNVAVGSSRSTPYALLGGTVGASRSTPYLVTVAAGASRTTPYTVLRIVGGQSYDALVSGSATAYWRMSNPGAGNTETDVVGGDQPGTWNGTPAAVSGISLAGDQGDNAVRFSGDDWVNVPALDAFTVPASNHWTMEVWHRRPAGVTGKDMGLMGSWIGGGGGGAMLWISFFTSDYSLAVAGTSANYLNSGVVPTAGGGWDHIVGTWDGTDYKLYVNGVLKVTKPWTTVGDPGGSTSAFRIGAYSSPASQPLNGELASAAYYATPLTGQDVLDRYNAGVAGGTPTSVATPYVVRTSVGSSRTAPYVVIGQVGRSTVTPYSVGGTAGSSRSTPYAVLATVGGSRSSPYIVRALAAGSRSTPYVVRSLVGRSVAAPYTLSAFAGSSVAVPYSVLTTTGSSRSTPYQIVGLVGTSRSTPYIVIARVGRSLATSYTVYPSIAFGLSTPYRVLVLAGRSVTTPYLVDMLLLSPLTAQVESQARFVEVLPSVQGSATFGNPMVVDADDLDGDVIVRPADSEVTILT